MFKSFKRKNVTPEVIAPVAPEKIIETQEEPKKEPKIKSVFPTAEEMANLSSETWTVATTDMILEEIYREARNGKRHVSFYKTILPETIAKELKSLGFKVDISELYKAPCFELFW